MLEEKQSLPGAQHEPAFDDGNVLVDVGQDHPDVRGHVVRPLVGVDEVGGVLGHQVIEKRVEVGPRRGVGVFHDHEAATGVADEDGGDAVANAALGNDSLDLVRDLVGALPSRRDGESFAVDLAHDVRTKNDSTSDSTLLGLRPNPLELKPDPAQASPPRFTAIHFQKTPS